MTKEEKKKKEETFVCFQDLFLVVVDSIPLTVIINIESEMNNTNVLYKTERQFNEQINFVSSNIFAQKYKKRRKKKEYILFFNIMIEIHPQYITVTYIIYRYSKKKKHRFLNKLSNKQEQRKDRTK